MCESIMNVTDNHRKEFGKCAPNYQPFHIPLICSSCADVGSPLYDLTNKYQFIIKQKAELAALERQKAKQKKKNTGRDESEEQPTLQIQPDYHSPEFLKSSLEEQFSPVAIKPKVDPVLQKYKQFESKKRALLEQFGKQLEYKTSPHYRRISPEMEHLFEPNVIADKQKDVPKPEILTFRFEDPREVQGGPIVLDNKATGLAKYLTQVMENNEVTNAMYGIKFDGQDLKPEPQKNRYDVLIPTVIEGLLNKIVTKRSLSPQELELFADFLNVASQLQPSNFDSYFKLLYRRGVALFGALDKLRAAFTELDSFDLTVENVKNFISRLSDAILHGDPAENKKRRRSERLENARRMSQAIKDADDWAYTTLHGKAPRGVGIKDPRVPFDLEAGTTTKTGPQEVLDKQLKPGDKHTNLATQHEPHVTKKKLSMEKEQKHKHSHHQTHRGEHAQHEGLAEHSQQHGEHGHHHADHSKHHPHHKHHHHEKESLTPEGASKKHRRSHDDTSKRDTDVALLEEPPSKKDIQGLSRKESKKDIDSKKSDKKIGDKKEKSSRLTEKKHSDKSILAKKESTAEQDAAPKRRSSSIARAEHAAREAKEAKKAETLKLEVIRKMERIADEKRKEAERREKEEAGIPGHFAADLIYEDRSKELVEKSSIPFMKPNVEREFRLKLASAMSAAQKYADKTLFIQDSYSIEDIDPPKRGTSADFYGDQTLKELLQKSSRNVYNDTLRLMERFSFMNSGAHMPGYYEPWDVDFPWADIQALFENLNKVFMKSPTNPNFAFRRGMEYYQNMFKRENEQKPTIESSDRKKGRK